MEKIRAWLRRRDFEMRVGRSQDCVDFGAQEVRVSARQSKLRQVHSALHECGHVEIFRLRVLQRRRVVAGSTLRAWAFSRRKTKQEKLRVLEEELDAWRRGELLGRRLRVKMPAARERDRHRTACLATYVKWAAAPRRRPSKA